MSEQIIKSSILVRVLVALKLTQVDENFESSVAAEGDQKVKEERESRCIFVSYHFRGQIAGGIVSVIGATQVSHFCESCRILHFSIYILLAFI